MVSHFFGVTYVIYVYYIHYPGIRVKNFNQTVFKFHDLQTMSVVNEWIGKEEKLNNGGSQR